MEIRRLTDVETNLNIENRRLSAVETDHRLLTQENERPIGRAANF